MYMYVLCNSNHILPKQPNTDYQAVCKKDAQTIQPIHDAFL